MKYYVYVIKSLIRKILYIGQTQNLERRLKEHNSGKVFFTKPWVPYELVYKEEFDSRLEAVAREKELKKGYNREQLKRYVYSGELPEWLKERFAKP